MTTTPTKHGFFTKKRPKRNSKTNPVAAQMYILCLAFVLAEIFHVKRQEWMTSWRVQIPRNSRWRLEAFEGSRVCMWFCMCACVILNSTGIQSIPCTSAVTWRPKLCRKFSRKFSL